MSRNQRRPNATSLLSRPMSAKPEHVVYGRPGVETPHDAEPRMLELDTREGPALCSGQALRRMDTVGIVRGGSAAVHARTRHREAYGESDRGDGPGCWNGRDDAGRAAR